MENWWRWMKMNDLKTLYENNPDFHKYVDRYCRNYNRGRSIPLEEALRHAEVRNVAAYYRENTPAVMTGSSSTFMPQGECV